MPSYLLIVGMVVGGTSGVPAAPSTDSLPFAVLGQQSTDRWETPSASLATLMTATTWTQQPGPDWLAADGAHQLTARLLAVEALGTGVPCGELAPGEILRPVSVQSDAEIHYLPGSPTSAELFLTTVLGLGAWHMVRRPPHLNLGHLPEWYSTNALADFVYGAPSDQNVARLIACAFAELARTQPVLFQRPCDPRARCTSAFFLSVQAARAPPMASHNVLLTCLCSAPRSASSL